MAFREANDLRDGTGLSSSARRWQFACVAAPSKVAISAQKSPKAFSWAQDVRVVDIQN